MARISGTSTSTILGTISTAANELYELKNYNEPPQKSCETGQSARFKPTTGAKRKTRRKVPKRFKLVRGKFAILERLVRDVPLEIIIEARITMKLSMILCHLDPGDLLRLSRASKGLRNILLSKTSESIWRVARENFIPGLPPLPMDLNEPQYARLFFDMFVTIIGDATMCSGGSASDAV
ncbi:hypothetical protein HHX47_DHR3001166 [Lentinula edodes]|nr:hypothetical protein HHX47_DHR3001166 [Lentinula edodes]